MLLVGIVLGLCLRAGTIANITLPDYFWKIFCNEPHEIVSAVTATEEEEENPLKRNFLLCCGLAMRHGMTSCLPESYLDILTPCDLKTLLNGGGTLNVENLRLFASYCSPVCENDDSVEVFWLALSDLPRLSLFKFLQYLWSCDENNSIEHLSDGTTTFFTCSNSLIELYYWRNSNLPLGQIRIGYSDYQEEDSATTTSEPSHSGIMIPEYGVILLPRNVTTYVAMSTHVKILIDAL